MDKSDLVFIQSGPTSLNCDPVYFNSHFFFKVFVKFGTNEKSEGRTDVMKIVCQLPSLLKISTATI